jgi:Lon protease-like protein
MPSMPPSQPQTLGLFPLPTVLLPGAALGLRVFEPRYLDLVRDCSRGDSGFGVCLLLPDEGEEGAVAATPAAYGTEARIEDFGNDDDGLRLPQPEGIERARVAQGLRAAQP